MIKNKGIALAEILIGAAIISTGILAAISAYSAYIEFSLANQKNIQASFLLEEGMEVMTFYRDKGWINNISKLSTTTTYYLNFINNNWATTTNPQYVDGEFLRKITLEDVFRDANDQISSVGTYDPDIRKITTTIEYWQGHATTTRAISTYVTNLYNN